LKLVELFRNKKNTWKEKVISLKQTGRINIRDLFKKGYQPRTNLVKDENDDLLADSRSILNSWKNFICQLLNVRSVNNVRQTEMCKAEPLLPEPSCFEVEIATESLKGYKSLGIDQILAELVQAGGNAF
jgi:hypothetical protein